MDWRHLSNHMVTQMAILRKLLVKKITISLSVITILLFSNNSIAISPDYLGNYCFSLHQTNPPSEEKTINLKMAVTHTGDAYYLLQATANRPTNTIPMIFTGTAVVIGNEVFVTANGTYEHTDVFDRSTYAVQMDLNSSLNGKFWVIQTSFDKTIDYGDGTATLIPCQ